MWCSMVFCGVVYLEVLADVRGVHHTLHTSFLKLILGADTCASYSVNTREKARRRHNTESQTMCVCVCACYVCVCVCVCVCTGAKQQLGCLVGAARHHHLLCALGRLGALLWLQGCYMGVKRTLQQCDKSFTGVSNSTPMTLPSTMVSLEAVAPVMTF
jgi:hypothetical protein